MLDVCRLPTWRAYKKEAGNTSLEAKLPELGPVLFLPSVHELCITKSSISKMKDYATCFTRMKTRPTL